MYKGRPPSIQSFTLSHSNSSGSQNVHLSMLIFGVRRLLSLKNCQMRPQNSFWRFSLKIQLFSKKLLNKKIFGIKFLIKKAIFILGVRWHLTGRTVTQLDVLQTKFRPLQPLLLRSEISLFWRTSCARDFFLRWVWGKNLLESVAFFLIDPVCLVKNKVSKIQK